VSDRKIKVTDKRLFTADGELREEYRDIGRQVTSPENVAKGEESGAGDPVPQDPQPQSPADSPTVEPPAAATGSRSESAAPPLPRPSFLDLVATVAQPIAVYLGDVKMPDGESMENLQLARLHIDLLEVLKSRTAGNLSDQEERFLEDLLYELKLRYVEKAKQDGRN
jgi:hypothetical protein